MFPDKQKLIVAIPMVACFLCYSFYLYTSLPVKVYETNYDAGKGQIVWQKYNCNACHQLYGLGGYLGPDLTNTYTLKGTDYIKAFVNNGTTVMPNFHLSEQEMNALLSYLKCIDATGRSDPRTFILNYNGTIEQ